jgi:hypothetical protein
VWPHLATPRFAYATPRYATCHIRHACPPPLHLTRDTPSLKPRVPQRMRVLVLFRDPIDAIMSMNNRGLPKIWRRFGRTFKLHKQVALYLNQLDEMHRQVSTLRSEPPPPPPPPARPPTAAAAAARPPAAAARPSPPPARRNFPDRRPPGPAAY